MNKSISQYNKYLKKEIGLTPEVLYMLNVPLLTL